MSPAQMATWHLGDVVLKLMQAHQPPLKKGKLAELAGVRPNTITDLLRGKKSDEDTIEKVARVFGKDGTELRQMRNALNNLPFVEGAPPGRGPLSLQREDDKDPVLHEWIQNARRIAKLPRSARTVMYNMLNVFEEMCTTKTP